MILSLNKTIVTVALELSQATRVFEKLKIDYRMRQRPMLSFIGTSEQQTEPKKQPFMKMPFIDDSAS